MAAECLGLNSVDIRTRAWPSVNGGADGRRKRYGHSSVQSSNTGVSARWLLGQGTDSVVRLQTAADRAASKHIDDSRNRGRAGALADATSHSGRRRRRDTRDWRTGGLSRSWRGDLSRNQRGATGPPGHERQLVHAVNGKQGFQPDGRRVSRVYGAPSGASGDLGVSRVRG